MQNKMGKFIKEHRMSLFVVVCAIIMLVGLSYAWLQLTLWGEKELTLRAGTLELNLDDSMSEGITMVDVVPISDEEGLESSGYTFTLENTGNVDSNYEIYLDDLEIPESDTRMKDNFIKYELIRNEERISFDLLNTIGENPKRLLDKGEIGPKEKHTYTLKLWIASTATNEVMGTIFKGQLRVEAMQGEGKGLYRMMAKKAVPDDEASEFVTSSTGIDFAQAPSDTNGKGIYTLASTKKDRYPVHYFRGEVTTNNVRFGGFCWKIVRTTSTGGVKMIYNGEPGNNGDCSNTTGVATQIGKSAFNNTGSPADVGYMYGNRDDYIYQTKSIDGINEAWIYGNDIEWDGERYVLKDTIESNPINWKNNYKTTAIRHHYTCFNTENSCREVGYIHYFEDSSPIHFLSLKGGKTIEDAKKEMFRNTTDSKVKTVIDTWYHDYMLDYTSLLEDTVWCNDRSIDRGPLKSKDEDSSVVSGSNQNNYTMFGARERNMTTKKPSVICPNNNDSFTVSKENGNGDLTYPVALLTADEMTLAGHGYSGYSKTSYLCTGEVSWSMSPSSFNDKNGYIFYLFTVGRISIGNNVAFAYGVRPAISLVPRTKIVRGDGTSSNPYIVK